MKSTLHFYFLNFQNKHTNLNNNIEKEKIRTIRGLKIRVFDLRIKLFRYGEPPEDARLSIWLNLRSVNRSGYISSTEESVAKNSNESPNSCHYKDNYDSVNDD